MDHSGPKYGLSENTWEIIKKTKGISKLYDWEEECLTQALQTDKNLIYSLTTSGGKTLVAELLMIRDSLQAERLQIRPTLHQHRPREGSYPIVGFNMWIEYGFGIRE